MIQGDKYYISISLKENETIITPDNCLGVKIKIGTTEKTSESGELIFNSGTNCWQFPMTQEESLKFGSSVPIQAQILFANNVILNTVPKYLPVEYGIIREVWE